MLLLFISKLDHLNQMCRYLHLLSSTSTIIKLTQLNSAKMHLKNFTEAVLASLRDQIVKSVSFLKTPAR